MEQIRKFTIEFFNNLKCSISDDGDILVVENVPKSFEDLFGGKSPYHICFTSGNNNCEFVGKGSAMFVAMTKFLDGAGKTTLLKIDFDCDPKVEINKAISLKNCEINNITKRHKNNFISRFTFVTAFRHMNRVENVINEIYVHNGEIVNGDLEGYTVLEGKIDEISNEHIEKDYGIAHRALKDLLSKKASNIEETLKETLEKEIDRIHKHYDNLLNELGGDLSNTIEKIQETELTLKTSDESKIEILRSKLNRLKSGLVKIGKDDSRERILKEQEFTVRDAIQKHSLNIDNNLVNTTVIYYPVFNFNLFLKGDSAERFVNISYDPLTKTLNKLNCESCGRGITHLNLCSAGHINCDDCLERCGECGKIFCKKCLTKSCSACGKKLCKNCATMCLGCGKYVCKDDMREDCVSGEERCVGCLRACSRCHGLSQPKFFGEAIDGSKICQKCLGKEKRDKVLTNVFGE